MPAQRVFLQPFSVTALGPRVSLRSPEDDSWGWVRALLQPRSDAFEGFQLFQFAHGGQCRRGGEDALGADCDACGVDLVDLLDDLVGGLRAAVDVDLAGALGAARRR